MVVGKVVVHLCMALTINELKISVEHDRVVTTLNMVKHEISYLVQCTYKPFERLRLGKKQLGFKTS